MSRPKLKQIWHRSFWKAWLPMMASTVYEISFGECNFAFWKTHKCKLIPKWTRKTVWLPINNIHEKICVKDVLNFILRTLNSLLSFVRALRALGPGLFPPCSDLSCARFQGSEISLPVNGVIIPGAMLLITREPGKFKNIAWKFGPLGWFARQHRNVNRRNEYNNIETWT